MPPHLFVDISAHGLGHLAQAAPILNELARLLPELRLTVRSGLSAERLRSRLSGDFVHLEQRSDFGFVMHDAVSVDHAATAAAYRDFHADWSPRVAAEAALLRALRPDLLLADVAYLPLAGAARAGIPALAMCSLNWADLFAHFFGGAAWAAPLHRQILDAYRSAECFLRLTPAMPMGDLPRQRAIAPVATLAADRRDALRHRLGCARDDKLVLIAFGGFAIDLPLTRWPRLRGVHWLIPAGSPVVRDDMSAFEALGLPFADLLRSVDAVLTKPGYGTFTDAACNGTPVLYLRRDDWPEQDCLIDWLEVNARCAQVTADDLASGQLADLLDTLWRKTPPPTPTPDGAREVAVLLHDRLRGNAAVLPD